MWKIQISHSCSPVCLINLCPFPNAYLPFCEPAIFCVQGRKGDAYFRTINGGKAEFLQQFQTPTY